MTLFTRPCRPMRFIFTPSDPALPGLSNQGCEGSFATVQSQEDSVERMKASTLDMLVTQKTKLVIWFMPDIFTDFCEASQTSGWLVRVEAGALVSLAEA